MPVITERLVRSLRPRERKYELTCAALRGFTVRVLPSGKKVYFARYRSRGRDVRRRIGPAGELSCASARQLAARLLASAHDDEPAPSVDARGETADASPYVHAFARRFVDGHVKLALKPASARRYQLTLKNHILPRFGEQRLAAITREQVETWIGSLAETPQAARCAWQVLSSMLGKAYQWGALPPSHVNPARGVRTRRARARDRFLSAEERRRLDAVLQRGLETPRNQRGGLHWATAYAIRTLALTGMRSCEVYGLSWDRVDMSRRSFRLADSKTGQRVVPFSAEVHALLREAARLGGGRSRWVFPSLCGDGHVAKASVGRAWRRIRAAAGLGPDVVIHSLRHSFASDALMSGVPIAIVGRLLGHRRPRTTARYAHVADEALEEALRRTSARIIDAQRGA